MLKVCVTENKQRDVVFAISGLTLLALSSNRLSRLKSRCVIATLRLLDALLDLDSNLSHSYQISPGLYAKYRAV